MESGSEANEGDSAQKHNDSWTTRLYKRVKFRFITRVSEPGIILRTWSVNTTPVNVNFHVRK